MHHSNPPCPNVNIVHRSFSLSPCGMWSYIFPFGMCHLHVPWWSVHFSISNVIHTCSHVKCDPYMFPAGMWCYMFPGGMWSLHVPRWNVLFYVPGGAVFIWHEPPGQVWPMPLEMESFHHLIMMISPSINYFLVFLQCTVSICGLQLSQGLPAMWR